MKTSIVVESTIEETPRVEQVRGLFDLEPEKTSRCSWSVELPLEGKPWSVGLITGPSGCGKSTIARRLFTSGKSLWSEDLPSWSSRLAVVDGFPESMSVKEVTELLSSVGFSSPPAWLRPYTVLSTGQKFRCDLARLIAHARGRQSGHGAQGDPATGQNSEPHETPLPLVFDEYTSVVDRTVAQIGSAAVAKQIRKRKLQFVAVTCHEDVIDWLQPDWVYYPAEARFDWRSVQQRPRIQLELTRTTASAWRLFAPHHYLSADLNRSAVCFLALWRQRPVAFSAWLPFVGSGPNARREHRTVCLPDYQGVGIGNAVCESICSMWKALGYFVRSTTTHPAMVQYRRQSDRWRLVRAPSFGGTEGGKFRSLKHATTRLTTGWEYVGPAMNKRIAERLLRG